MVIYSQYSRPLVLFFEEDAERLDLARLKQSHKQVEFVGVSDPLEALEILADKAVALIVCGVKMEKMDGIEFLTRVGNISPDTLKILLNCSFEPELVIQAINKCKVWKCLTHPWPEEEIDNHIRDGLEIWKGRSQSTERPIVERPDFYLLLVRKISDLLNESEDFDYILQKTVQIISSSLNYDVVSIYLFNTQKKTLEMRANIGLQVQENIDNISLDTNEGLTGFVFNSRRPIVAMPASKHPQYKFFPQLGEENYESYIGVPVLLGNRALGVLVAQIKEQKSFSPAEETLLQIIASRLSGLIELGDKIKRLKRPAAKKHASHVYQGKGISAGYAVGPVYLLRGLFTEVSLDHLTFAGVKAETARLKHAFNEVEKEQKQLINYLVKKGDLSKNEIKIFKAHLMIVQDTTSFSTISQLIQENLITAEKAVVEGFEAFASHFEKQNDRYFQERVQDLRDIGEKILRHLLEKQERWEETTRALEGAVVVAENINPSMLPILDKENVAAIITEKGGVTSHVAILAKSLGIPAVSAVENLCNIVTRGQEILVDGRSGMIFLNPDEHLLEEYRKNHEEQTQLQKSFEKTEPLSDSTDLPIKLSANVGFPADIEFAQKYHIKNIGLLRTEFTFMQYERWPSLHEQYRIYDRIAQSLPGVVTIRTLDVGADKVLPYFKFPKEENPMLGLRSIRFSMEYLDYFKDQIKAIMMGVKNGRTFRILLPMVSTLWEIETAKEIINQMAKEMDMPADMVPELGIMAEVPAVLHQLDDFSEYINFISVGTNDLIQYLLAVDRNSDVVSHLYSSFHPAVIRVMYEINQKGEEVNLEVTACGEMAGSPLGALTLLALGYTNLSILPTRIPAIRFLVKRLNKDLLLEIREKILKEKQQKEIERYLQDVLTSLDPRLLDTM
ncbi:MAG: phosphoenolpyruvate--protein phosphotransferase [Fibrobacteria bacterium]|nr:phosphoenolpyruvate--protein phosphotransferase [Fibrobacteria bacterium]